VSYHGYKTQWDGRENFNTICEQRVNTQQQVRDSIPDQSAIKVVVFAAPAPVLPPNLFDKHQRHWLPLLEPMGMQLLTMGPSLSISYLHITAIQFLFLEYSPYWIHYPTTLSNACIEACGIFAFISGMSLLLVF
jgi:hypothetical protein